MAETHKITFWKWVSGILAATIITLVGSAFAFGVGVGGQKEELKHIDRRVATIEQVAPTVVAISQEFKDISRRTLGLETSNNDVRDRVARIETYQKQIMQQIDNMNRKLDILIQDRKSTP